MTSKVITKRNVDAAVPGASKRILWDNKVKGFGLKITPAGNKTYIYQFRLAARGAAERTAPSIYTIGKHGPWTPETARKEAERISVLVSRGINPNREKRERIEGEIKAREEAERKALIRKRGGFLVVAERWLTDMQNGGKSEKYYQTSRWAVRHYLSPVLGDIPISEISPDHIQSAIDSVPAEMRATRLAVHDAAFAVFRWASGTAGNRLVSNNVVADVDRPKKPEPRDRVLDDEELAKVWMATERLPVVWRAFFRIAILTGKRRSEVACMKWSEIDWKAKEWLIPSGRVKNGVPVLVPLSPLVACCLEEIARHIGSIENLISRDRSSRFVFSNDGTVPIGNHSKMKATLDKAIQELNGSAPIPHWTLHDLRRTIATGFQRLGVRFEVTEALLNHTGRARAGVAGIYQRYDWRVEKREALIKWARHVELVVAGSASPNVVQLIRSERR